MARPQSFNADKALGAAMMLFWQRGYEATSMQQLVSVMGVNRASLYNSFGDKKALFRQCLMAYGNQARTLVVQASEGSGSGLEGLKRFFMMSFNVLPESLLRQGCLSVNTVSELSLVDEELADIANKALKNVQAELLKQVCRGQEDGSIAGRLNAVEVAENLMNMVRGLRIGLQGGLPLADSQKIINFNLKMLES